MEQINYASRYTRSRKQRSFCATAKYTLVLRTMHYHLGISIVCGIEETNNNDWPVKPRAQLLGFTQTVGIVTAVLSLARVGLPRCKLLFFLVQFTSFNALSLSSTPFASGLYEFKNVRTNFRNRLVLLVRFVENSGS